MERPNFREQVTVIAGDCVVPNMGLSEADRQLLMKEVDIIFHCAATVRFDEKLRVAVNINMNGTKCILEMGREMKNLKVKAARKAERPADLHSVDSYRAWCMCRPPTRTVRGRRSKKSFISLPLVTTKS